MNADEDEDIPETSECERLVNSFAEITSTDVACAQFYLQDRKWNLEKSVNDYFKHQKGKCSPGVSDMDEDVTIADQKYSDSREPLGATASSIHTQVSKGTKRKRFEEVEHLNSDSGEDDIPESAECERLVTSFAEVTGTDVACAQFYLQDRKWDLERSINDFFNHRKSKGSLSVNENNEATVIINVDGSHETLAAAATAVIAESVLSKGERRRRIDEVFNKSSSASSSETKPSIKNNLLRFITWNMDGISPNNLFLRTKAIAKRICSEEADIVYLQEVVPEAASYFMKTLTDYKCLFGNDLGYFSAIFLKEATVKYENHAIIPFAQTLMMRNILQINAMFEDVPLLLMTSHFESTKEGENERKAQLRESLHLIVQADDRRNVIFGGDLNLRDKELAEIGGLPIDVADVWEKCGRRKEVTYTWDMTRNDNITYPGKFKPRLRFDRVFLRCSNPPRVNAMFFGLIGLERLLPHQCFASDHWGILCHFQVQ